MLRLHPTRRKTRGVSAHKADGSHVPPIDWHFPQVSPLPVDPSSFPVNPRSGPPVRPITDTADPRWVLAVRTAESLEGVMLRPERRAKLEKVGRLLGLSPFDVSLVLAIVQDQARRGITPESCPAAGAAQLALIPPPQRRASGLSRRARRIAIALGVLLAGEVLLLLWWFA